jgi:hypothetical protein
MTAGARGKLPRAMAERTLVFERKDRCLVLVQNAAPTSPSEFEEFVAFGMKDPALLGRILVMTDGGVPDLAQREQMDRLVRSAEILPRTAVVSSSFTARMLVRVVSVMNPSVQSFRPDDLRGAFNYLEVPYTEQVGLLEVIARLRMRLGLRPQL